MHYKFILLIIANDTIYYNMMKKSLIDYYKNFEEIKFYFVYGINTQPTNCDDQSEYDLIIPVIDNLYDGIIRKTIMAMKNIKNMDHTYDYIIRTNISSVFDITELIKLPLQQTKCYAGILSKFPDTGELYVSGAGSILSYDVVDKIINNKYKLYPEHDDLMLMRLIGDYATAYIPENFIRITNIDEITKDAIQYRFKKSDYFTAEERISDSKLLNNLINKLKIRDTEVNST